MTTKELKTLLQEKGSYVISDEDTSSDTAINELLDSGFAIWSDRYDDVIVLSHSPVENQ